MVYAVIVAACLLTVGLTARAEVGFQSQTQAQVQPPEVRERMAELLLLPKDKLWKELSKWPSFKKMTLEEQSAFLARLAAMKKQTQKRALDHAVRIGLAIPPDKHDAFTDDYLRERLHLHRKFIAEKKTGKAPSPEAFDKELNRRLTKKYGPAVTATSPTSPKVPSTASETP